MTSAAVAQLLLRHPFQPFYFVLGDNTEVHVDRAEKVRHKPGERIAYVTHPDGDESIIDLELVALVVVKGRK
jgi:hypothetical protein